MFELLKLSRASSQRHCVYCTLLHVSCRFEAQLPQFKLIDSADMLDSVLLDNGAILKDLVIIGATGTYKLILSSKVAASNDASAGELIFLLLQYGILIMLPPLLLS
jgi:hypothetical protein